MCGRGGRARGELKVKVTRTGLTPGGAGDGNGDRWRAKVLAPIRQKPLATKV